MWNNGEQVDDAEAANAKAKFRKTLVVAGLFGVMTGAQAYSKAQIYIIE